jgi:GNAT superfamily N-acetyltransferase
MQTRIDLALPPAQIPRHEVCAAEMCIVRPLELSDEATAFMISEIAFWSPGILDNTQERERQNRWEHYGRQWFAWLHQLSKGSAYAAVRVRDGMIAGYIRVIRDPIQQIEQLTELYIRPEFQRGGVGRALLDAALPRGIQAGWDRQIIAHSDHRVIAIYVRRGTYPITNAFYIRPYCRGDQYKQFVESLPSIKGTIVALNPLNHATFDDIDRTVFGHGHSLHHDLLMHYLRAKYIGLLDGSRLIGYGVHTPSGIGPVVATTAGATLALISSLYRTTLEQTGELPGIWVPGANCATLRWFSSLNIPVRYEGQVIIMSSNLALGEGLDRVILTSPPYIL